MEIKVDQDDLPALFVADTELYPFSIRIISGSRIITIQKSSIPELIDALNKLK